MRQEKRGNFLLLLALLSRSYLAYQYKEDAARAGEFSPALPSLLGSVSSECLAGVVI